MYFVFVGDFVGILIYFGNFWDMLEIFGDPSSGFYQSVFDAALFKWTERQGLPQSPKTHQENKEIGFSRVEAKGFE